MATHTTDGKPRGRHAAPQRRGALRALLIGLLAKLRRA
jgi:hypothetical protein